eukprot:COSAG06_NODE_3231_length_5643_cov_6.529942_6_plen_82_part_00
MEQVYRVLLRDTGVWRLAEVAPNATFTSSSSSGGGSSSSSGGSSSGGSSSLHWPGRAVYECTEQQAGGAYLLKQTLISSSS